MFLNKCMFLLPRQDVCCHSEANTEGSQGSSGLLINGPHADSQHQEECHDYFCSNGTGNLGISGHHTESCTSWFLIKFYLSQSLKTTKIGEYFTFYESTTNSNTIQLCIPSNKHSSLLCVASLTRLCSLSNITPVEKKKSVKNWCPSFWLHCSPSLWSCPPQNNLSTRASLLISIIQPTLCECMVPLAFPLWGGGQGDKAMMP